MRIKVIKKQKQARFCIVCGMENPLGLKTRFYNLENGAVAGLVKASKFHQSYPGRVHGGVISALLDEAIGRAIQVTEENTWGVTGKLEVRFRKPVPYEEEILVLAHVTKNSRRLFTSEGKLFLSDGTLAAEATGEYMKLPLSSISDMDEHGKDWMLYPDQEEVSFIEIPE